MKFAVAAIVVLSLATGASAFSIVPPSQRVARVPVARAPVPALRYRIGEDLRDAVFATEQDRNDAINDLLSEDAWESFGQRLSHSIRGTISDAEDDVKELANDASDKWSNLSNDIDQRVRAELKKMRENSDYNMDDFDRSIDDALDQAQEKAGYTEYSTKAKIEELKMNIKSNVRDTMDDFTGAGHDAADVARSIKDRVGNRANEYTKKADRKISDIADELNDKRKKWVDETFGEDGNGIGQKIKNVGTKTKKVAKNVARKTKNGIKDVADTSDV